MVLGLGPATIGTQARRSVDAVKVMQTGNVYQLKKKSKKMSHMFIGDTECEFC